MIYRASTFHWNVTLENFILYIRTCVQSRKVTFCTREKKTKIRRKVLMKHAYGFRLLGLPVYECVMKAQCT